jgi:lysylphosphatidylglycerol synthetase-like protein (DUF2156 family)
MVLLIIYGLVNLQSHTFHPSNMSPSKLRSFLGISIAILCLIAVPLQSHAADKSKTKAAHSEKERLVLMPIRVPEEDKNLTGAKIRDPHYSQAQRFLRGHNNVPTLSGYFFRFISNSTLPIIT